jgi:hypothetical protein
MKRRTLLAAGISLLATPMILKETAAMAVSGDKTKMDAMPQPQFNQFKLGSYKFTVFNDGATIAEKPFETFGTNQKPETVQGLLARNFLPTDKFVNTYAPTLIDTGSDVILVDTGFGEGGRARGGGLLRDGLKAAGRRHHAGRADPSAWRSYWRPDGRGRTGLQERALRHRPDRIRFLDGQSA